MKAAQGSYIATQTINVIVAMVGVAGIIATINKMREFFAAPYPSWVVNLARWDSLY